VPKKTLTERRDQTPSGGDTSEPEFNTASQELIRKAELHAMSQATRRAELNESLARLLIACAAERGSCASIRATWARALSTLEEPYRAYVERWCREQPCATAA
jgi:hypothetical protein